ncbi:MAG: RHS repeat-associated core domain-containing protein, partial [Euryarchaeota archaeon]|nr:RHS repeat-associated core domain-containing protein [Euryarchaeota archaeon]
EQDATGLYYFGARYYDPLIGRFITTDPVKGDQMNPQTFNPYVYCLNNPLKYIDPAGERPLNWPEEDWWGKDYGNTGEGQEGEGSSKRTPQMSGTPIEITERDFPVDSVGVEFNLSFLEILGVSGGVGFVIDENLDLKAFKIEQIGGGILPPGGSVRAFISSLNSEEMANSKYHATEANIAWASGEASGDMSGPIPQTLAVGAGMVLPVAKREGKWKLVPFGGLWHCKNTCIWD